MACNCNKSADEIGSPQPSMWSKMFPIFIVLCAIALAWFFFMREKGPYHR